MALNVVFSCYKKIWTRINLPTGKEIKWPKTVLLDILSCNRGFNLNSKIKYLSK